VPPTPEPVAESEDEKVASEDEAQAVNEQTDASAMVDASE
jgi:hypothetical protein